MLDYAARYNGVIFEVGYFNVYSMTMHDYLQQSVPRKFLLM